MGRMEWNVPEFGMRWNRWVICISKLIGMENLGHWVEQNIIRKYASNDYLEEKYIKRWVSFILLFYV